MVITFSCPGLLGVSSRLLAEGCLVFCVTSCHLRDAFFYERDEGDACVSLWCISSFCSSCNLLVKSQWLGES